MTATRAEIPIPVVDDERIQETYEELKGMQVELDPNPIEFGPRRFNNRIAQVRSMLNRVEQLFLQASEDLHYFKRIINAKKGLYDLEKRELMVKDPSCRVGRSQGEREALADVRLRSMIEEIQLLEASAHDLETVMSSIKSKRTDLKDVQGRMRDQMKMVEHDISMGARWGNREPAVAMQVVGGSTDELDGMLADVDKSLGWSGDTAPEPIVGLEDVSEEEEEDDDEEAPAPPIVKPKAATKPKPRAPELVIVLVSPSQSEGKDDVSDVLEAAFSGRREGPQFGDGALVATADIDTFLSDLDDLKPARVEISPSDGIDDLIASLAND